MDREMVIKQLENDAIATDTGYVEVPLWLFSEILALLKEQEAVKPKSKSRHGEYPQIVHRCGSCNEILYRYYKFCPSCGKAVKWE